MQIISYFSTNNFIQFQETVKISHYERDVFLTLPTDHQKPGESVLLRGKFPHHFLTSRANISSVEGSFRNLTNLVIPTAVSIFLSLGPKFMLPAFTNLSKETIANDWDRILSELKRAEYPGIEMAVMHRTLRQAFNKHTTDIEHTRRIDKHLLSLAHSTSLFLKRHQKTVVLVEGDKGKLVGLVERPEFVILCNKYVQDGVSTGRYVKSSWVDDNDVFTNQKKLLEPIISHFLGNFPIKPKGLCLFMPVNRRVRRKYLEEISRMNKYVASLLRRINWKVPVFRPSLKFHKTPAKLRPIVSKRFTPSIQIGKAILFALKKIM